jgi:hypothetical protein
MGRPTKLRNILGEIMDVWRIKLSAKDARSGRVPFSLFYLFPGDAVEEFRDVFETFIGFAARHSTINWDLLRTQRINDQETDTFLTQVIRDLVDADKNWHVAVPILSLNKRPPNTHLEETTSDSMDLKGVLDLYQRVQGAEDGPRPAYLSERAWQTWKAIDGVPTPTNPAYPATSYFVTRDDIFIPPCLACPRLGQHEAGECHLGDPVCYVSLRYYNASARMFVKLREFDEYQETIDGLPSIELPSTDAQPEAPLVPPDAD